jgi:hypothetical protein
VEATLEAGEPMTLMVRGEARQLRRDQAIKIVVGRPHAANPGGT